jgi:hypothetical protein
LKLPLLCRFFIKLIFHLPLAQPYICIVKINNKYTHFEDYGLLGAIPRSLIQRFNVAEKMAASVFIIEESDVRERRV